MKGPKIRFLSVIATFMLISSILSSQALAVARSSKYLDAYGTYVSPVGNGKIVITIDVDALRSKNWCHDNHSLRIKRWQELHSCKIL